MMKTIISKNQKTLRKGFTLTEVLLAVMIVGLIGVALASLTRAAAREGGVGRSKIMLRNNLSSFMRTLRNDLAEASVLNISADGTGTRKLLEIGKNIKTKLNATDADEAIVGTDISKITYCFVEGTDTANIAPADAKRGGEIYRFESDSEYSDCDNLSKGKLVLGNVKSIPSGAYIVPSFKRNIFSRGQSSNLLTVKLIVELNSTPIVNEVIEENFTTPMGY